MTQNNGFLKRMMFRVIFLGIFTIILIGVIAFARGYRLDIEKRTLTSTGIVSVNSSPKPGQVYVNGEFKGVTDINLTLPYGKYTVEIKKDGYTDWKKEIVLKGEIVMSADALLFSKNPSLTPLTNLGLNKALNIGQSNKLILFSQTGDAEKDGIYLFEATEKPLSIFPPLKPLVLIADNPLVNDLDFNTVQVFFSPDYSQGIFTFTYKDDPTKEVSYLLSTEEENEDLFDVTTSKENIITAWNEEKNEELIKIVEAFPKEIRKVATDSFQIIALSPDETKLLYRAKKDATLPMVIKPPLIGANQTPEHRDIEEGGIYVYDQKEDKNFKISVDLSKKPIPTPSGVIARVPTSTPTPTLALSPTPAEIPYILDEESTNEILSVIQWYPDSRHFVMKEDKHITIMEYDGGNKETVYSGPFESSFFGLSDDWNLLVIVNLNPQNNQMGDIYSIGIK